MGWRANNPVGEGAGVRLIVLPRVAAERDARTVRLKLLGRSYEIRAKASSIRERGNVKSEYDDLVRISREEGIPLRRIGLRE